MGNLTLTRATLDACKNLQEVFDLAPVAQNFIDNRVKTTGENREKATMAFEREKVLFFKSIANIKDKLDHTTVYFAFIELAVSGCSLLDGESYIVPYGGKASFQVGYKGRVNQMNMLPGIEYVGIPQVVYDCDDFDYERGNITRVLKHKPGKKTSDSFLTHVYIIIQRDNQKEREAEVMDRAEVLAIRDRYSQSYKSYVADCRAAGKEIGESFFKSGKRKDQSTYSYLVEPPMWVTSEPEAWKKTIVKRVYKWMPKTQRLKQLDAKIAANPDPEDGTTSDIDYGLGNADGTFTDVKADKNAPPPNSEPKPEQPAAAPKKTKEKAAEKPKPETKQQAPEQPTQRQRDIDDIANANTQDTTYEEMPADDQPDPTEEARPNLGDPMKGF